MDVAEACDESTGMMEVQNLMKRICHLERMVYRLSKDNSENDLLYLMGNEDMDRARHRRMIVQFIEKLNCAGSFTLRQLEKEK